MEKSQSNISFASSRGGPKSLNNSMSRHNFSMPKPKLCKVCKRGSFLKCFDCNVIYCSAKCQIKDWEDHQFTHAQNRFENQKFAPRLANGSGLGRESLQNRLNASRSDPVKPKYEAKGKAVDGKQPHTSMEVARAYKPNGKNLQDRLTTIRSEPIKHETEKNADGNCSMEVEEICSNFGTVTLQNTPHPMAFEESVVDQNLRKMITIRKFRRTVQLDPAMAEPGGFYFVAVLSEEAHPDGSLLYWITPFEQKDKLEAYRDKLQATYSSDNVPTISLQEVAKFRTHLVMAKIAGCWSRAQILNVDGEGIVGVECIDTGEKDICVYPKNALKVPGEPELMKSAFGIKVTFENVTEAGIVERGDFIKIRITQAVPYGTNFAEVQMQPDETTSEGAMEVEKSAEVAIAKSETRMTIDQIEIKELHEGNIKLLYCDGSRVHQGKLHVSESLKENWTLYAKIAEEVADFVKANPNAAGYMPVVRELILAKYTDDCYYRAVCVNASELDVKVNFIDYGSNYVVDVKEVYQLPEKLMYPCVSHTVDFKLASGNTLLGMNAENTREHLVTQNEFMAKVEKVSEQPRKYMITVDDSLIIF